jgi:hypothetical protein
MARVNYFVCQSLNQKRLEINIWLSSMRTTPTLPLPCCCRGFWVGVTSKIPAMVQTHNGTTNVDPFGSDKLCCLLCCVVWLTWFCCGV